MQIGWDSVMRMSADKRHLFLYEAFLYYNPLLLAVGSLSLSLSFLLRVHMWMPSMCSLVSMFASGSKREMLNLNSVYSLSIYAFIVILFILFQTLMVWLWGINLWFFAQAGVNYAKIFDLDQNHLSHREIWKVIIVTNLNWLLIPLFVLVITIIIDHVHGFLLTLFFFTFFPFSFWLLSLECSTDYWPYGFLCWWLQCATWMTIVVPTSMTAYLYLYSHGEVSYAASQPV